MFGVLRVRGFTLIELMVGIAITGVLAAIAIPSFNGMIRNNRAVSDANATLTLFYRARTAAIQKNRPVVICATTLAASLATPTCAAASWDRGAIVFVDNSPVANGVYDVGVDTLLSVEIPFSTGSTITGTAAAVSNKVTYLPDGTNSSAAGTIVIAPLGASSTNNPAKRCVVLASTGRARITDTTDTSASTCS